MQFEIQQLRAHLAQQGLDLAAEQEAVLLAPQVRGQPYSRCHVVEEMATEGLVEGLQPSPGKPPWPPDPRLHPASQSESPGRAQDHCWSREALTNLKTTSGTLMFHACGPPHPPEEV